MLVPVVAVAWADGEMDDEERGSVLSATADARLDVDGTGYRLLQRWLSTRPPSELFEAWKDYVRELSTSMPVETMRSLGSEILGRMQGAADASGSFFGIGRTASREEENVIAEVEHALADWPAMHGRTRFPSCITRPRRERPPRSYRTAEAHGRAPGCSR